MTPLSRLRPHAANLACLPRHLQDRFTKSPWRYHFAAGAVGVAMVTSGYVLSISPLINTTPSNASLGASSPPEEVADSNLGQNLGTRSPLTQAGMAPTLQVPRNAPPTHSASPTASQQSTPPPSATATESPTRVPSPTASEPATQTPAEPEAAVASEKAESTPAPDLASRGGTRSAASAPGDSVQISPALFPSLSDDNLEFLLSAIEPARQSQRATRVPASVTLAQAILESGWGRSTLATNAKNYFGIKAHAGPGPAGVYTISTQEFSNGRYITVQAAFRKYDTMEESFADHGAWLAYRERYAPAFDHTDDPREFAHAIHRAGYATSPTYATKLIQIMDQYDLYRFDVK